MPTTLILSVSVFSCYTIKVVKNFLHRPQINLKITNLDTIVVDFFFYFFHASQLLPHCEERVLKQCLERKKINLHFKHHVLCRDHLKKNILKLPCAYEVAQVALFFR